MSDYSNIQYEKVDDLPPRQNRWTDSPLTPDNIFNSLPFLANLTAGETVKIKLPEDAFGYAINTSKAGAKRFDSLRNALARTLKTLSATGRGDFVSRLAEGELYIKRLR